MKSVKFRIILLTIFTLSLLLFTIYIEYDIVQEDVKNNQKSLELISKTRDLSQVIHFLQQERGLSSSYIAKNDTAIYTKLIKQRRITDSLLKDKIKDADFVKNLDVLRKAIDKNKALWSNVKKFYTDKIDSLHNQIYISVENLNHAKKITQKLKTICDLAYARESLGVIRAIVSRYHQKGSLGSNDFLDVSQRYYDFKRRYKSALLSKSSSDFYKFKSQIQTPNFFLVKNQIELILKKQYGLLNCDTQQWWNEVTILIDTMYEVEKNLLDKATKFSENKILKSKKNLTIYTVLAILAFFTVALLSFLTVYKILKDLSVLMNKLNKVQENEDFSIRINLKSNYEFRQIAFSINRLLSYTDKLIKQKDKLASTDLLTGIMNRRSFMTLANKEIKRSQRYKMPLSLIFCDIDKFKSVNDNYGHQIGDQVLQEFAKSIQSQIRQSDLFARWGGEEFIILTTQTNINDAAKLAEKIRKNILKMSVAPVKNVTCSFGVAQLKEGENFEQLYKAADKAVYKAKETGRNKVVIISDK